MESGITNFAFGSTLITLMVCPVRRQGELIELVVSLTVVMMVNHLTLYSQQVCVYVYY